MQSKPMVQSKTFWLNIAASVPVLADTLAPMLIDPALTGIIPAAWLPYYTIAVTVANIWLRSRTRQPVTML